MDYKFRQSGIILSATIILMVVSVVVIANWRTISRNLGIGTDKKTSVSVAIPETEVSVEEPDRLTVKGNFTGNMQGKNLYAWREDEAFFDSEIVLDEVERRIVTEIIPAKTKRNEETMREEQ